MKIFAIKNAVLRLLVLLLIGIPAFSNWPISLLTSSNHYMQLSGLLSYWLFILVIVAVTFGVNQMTEWTLTASVLSVTVVLPQAVFTHALGKLSEWGFVTAGPHDNAELTFRLVKQFITMMTVIPYGAMLVHSFSVSGALKRAYSMSGMNRVVLRHACLYVRVAQHIFESFPPLLQIWREEYPTMLLPRYRTDMGNVFAQGGSVAKWLFTSAKMWALAACVFAFEPIPLFCHEIESLHREHKE